MYGETLYLTREGFEKLRSELEHLKTVKRRELSKEIGIAREKGDLKENAEYHAAKEAQGLCEKRIAELEEKLANVTIIEDLDISSDKIYIGAKIVLKDLESGEELKRMLVSGEEADFEKGKISIASPVGKGLLGHAEGETVEIQVPKGMLKYKILKISR